MSDALSVVLGAPDPEMNLVESLARDAGLSVVPAVDAVGHRVTAASAYQADVPLSWRVAGLPGAVPADGTGLVLVECADACLAFPRATRADHHRAGDPGYGRPPAEFLSASAVGQIYSRVVLPRSLDGADSEWYSGVGSLYHAGGRWWGDTPYGRVPIPTAVVLAAAADHCLAAAYHGECPGVDPEALMRWRVSTRAAYQQRDVSEILADIVVARAALAAAPRLDMGGVEVADMRPGAGAPDAGGWGDVPELPEAAARDGIAFIAIPRPGRDGLKLVLQAAPAAVVEFFLRGGGPAAGLTCLYGDPARGFAGGYL